MGVWEGRGPNVRPSAHSGWATLEGGIGSPRAIVSEVEPGLRGGQIAPFLMRCGALVSGYLPHSGVEGHFLGGFQAVDTGAGPESRGRSLRTPTCRRGHRQYLSSGPLYDFPRYRSTVHEVTQVFAAASREVLALEAELAGPRAQPLLASHVRSLQQLEETRLTTVRPRPPAVSPAPTLRLVSPGAGPTVHPLGEGPHSVPANPAPGAPAAPLHAPAKSSIKISLESLRLSPSFLPPLLSRTRPLHPRPHLYSVPAPSGLSQCPRSVTQPSDWVP